MIFKCVSSGGWERAMIVNVPVGETPTGGLNATHVVGENTNNGGKTPTAAAPTAAATTAANTNNGGGAERRR